LNPHFDEPYHRVPGDPTGEPARLEDLSPVLDPLSIITDPLFSTLGKYPFWPDDRMDWVFGFSFVAVPYAVSYLVGGPGGLATYSAVGPDFLLFATGVMVSNSLQSIGPAARVHAESEVEQSIITTNPFFGVPGYV